MTLTRGCCSSCEHFVKFKGVTARPILFSHLMRHDGEGAINNEELFADDRGSAYEQERIRQDELYSLMNSILDWAISFLGESTQGTIRAIYFEGKTVKQHSEEEYVTEYAIYKRLKRSYPVIKEVVLEELEDLDDETRAELEAMFGIGAALVVRSKRVHDEGRKGRRGSKGRRRICAEIFPGLKFKEAKQPSTPFPMGGWSAVVGSLTPLVRPSADPHPRSTTWVSRLTDRRFASGRRLSAVITVVPTGRFRIYTLVARGQAESE